MMPTHTCKHICSFISAEVKFFMAAKELASFQPVKNFKFFSNAKKKIKTPDTQANDNADRQNLFHNGQTLHSTDRQKGSR